MTQRDDVIPSVIRHLGELAVENIMKQNEVTNSATYTQRMEWNEWCVRRALNEITRRIKVKSCSRLRSPDGSNHEVPWYLTGLWQSAIDLQNSAMDQPQ